MKLYGEFAGFYTQLNFVELISSHSEEKIAINFAITVLESQRCLFNGVLPKQVSFSSRLKIQAIFQQ